MITNYLGIIPRNLIKNKKRTISIMSSIILAVMLITSVEILIRGIVNASMESSEELIGKFYGYYTNIYYNDILTLSQDERIDRSGFTSLVGYTKLEEKSLSVNGASQESIDMLNIKFLKGDYPREKEVALEEQVLNILFPGKKIGDKISLICEMQGLDKEASEKLKQFDFTLSGVFKYPNGLNLRDSGKIIINQNEAEKIMGSNNMKYDYYITTKKGLPAKDTITQFNKIYGEKYITRFVINNTLIEKMDLYEKSKKVVIVMDLIIALAAAVLIYNIFNISIMERIKHFGLLRSIGITPGQIKIIVMGEALLLGILSIPIGIISGAKLTSLLFNFLGVMGNKKIIIDSNTYNVITITAAGFISIITASFRPARAASLVSPLEAINSNICKIENLKAESFIVKVINSILGNTGQIAYMNLSRNRKKFASTVVSLTLGVMIFLGVNYLIDSIDPVKQAMADKESDFILNINKYDERIGYSNGQIETVKCISGIKNVKGYKVVYGTSVLKTPQMSEEGIKEIQSQNNEYVQKKAQNGEYHLQVYVIGCPEEEIDEIREKAKNHSYQDRDLPTVFVVEEKNYKKITNLKSEDILKINWIVNENSKYNDIEGKFLVEFVINEMPFKLKRWDRNLVLLTENKNVEKVFNQIGYQRVSINIEKDSDDEAIENELENIADLQNGGQLVSFSRDLEKIKRSKYQLSIILYGMFLVVALFALVNIMNTISVNIITRRREFGMLRALGMTNNQLRDMIVKEGLIYGFTGALFGFIFGVPLSYLIYKAANGNLVHDMQWEIQYNVVILVFIITVIVSTISTLVPLKKAISLNVIESIRSQE